MRDDDRRSWVHCESCQDESGAWRQMWCYGSGEHRNTASGEFERLKCHMTPEACGHPRAHVPHPYVIRCECHRAQWREEKRRMIAQTFSEDARKEHRTR